MKRKKTTKRAQWAWQMSLGRWHKIALGGLERFKTAGIFKNNKKLIELSKASIS